MSSDDTTTPAPDQAGADDTARDNAADSAAPGTADDVLGEGARDGVEPGAPTGDDDDTSRTRAPGDTAQPRTGAETPVDAEDLAHARGQDATPATLAAAQADLETDPVAAVEEALPDR